jgi:hypothetical protein
VPEHLDLRPQESFGLAGQTVTVLDSCVDSPRDVSPRENSSKPEFLVTAASRGLTPSLICLMRPAQGTLGVMVRAWNVSFADWLSKRIPRNDFFLLLFSSFPLVEFMFKFSATQASLNECQRPFIKVRYSTTVTFVALR